MKHFICGTLLLLFGCSHPRTNPSIAVRDGFYEVIARDSAAYPELLAGCRLLVPFDSLFEPSEGPIIIDTSDFVPLDLESPPSLEPFEDHRKLLSVALKPEAAEKLRNFTAGRVMRQVAIIMDSKAITIHKIREAITSARLQITRCSDEGCQYLFIKMKEKIK